ncbi:hypothetical protein F383_33783 [Gossypium arboreum]|uniref:Uncharacterized protein n=1 Tax=Gossypium arboreum TaxID=29729 RepID=A0A0B0PJC9_GOSAR|nr:hypothetical protein F383_33783 [Gossypium arboreum]
MHTDLLTQPQDKRVCLGRGRV